MLLRTVNLILAIIVSCSAILPGYAISAEKKSRLDELLKRVKNSQSSSDGRQESSSQSYEQIINKADELLKKQSNKIIETAPVIEYIEPEVTIQEPIKDYSPTSSPQTTKPAAAKPAPAPVVQEQKPETTKTQAETKQQEVVKEETVDPADEGVEVKQPVVEYNQKPEFVKIEGNVTTKDAEYLLVVQKSLKSLEEDPWNEVKYNMTEALEYFSKEKELLQDSKIDKFYKVTLALLKFANGGLELDQGDDAKFDEAESYYLDAEEILVEVKKKLGQDLTDRKLNEIISIALKYVEEDLTYIEEMVGY